MDAYLYKGRKTAWRLLALFVDVLLAACLCFWRQLVALSAYLAPQCMLRSATGLLCPTCGGTRVFVSLMQGDFAAALRYNWFVVLLAGYAGLVWVVFHAFCITGSTRVRTLLLHLVHYRAAIFFGLLAGCFFLSANLAQVCGWGSW